MAAIVFYLLGFVLLLLMAYWMWGGVGPSRPVMGRGFAAVALALAAYVAWLLYKLLD